MNISQFKIGLQEAENILKECWCFSEPWNWSVVSSEFIDMSKKGDYVSIYRLWLKNRDFNFILEDLSYFQYSYEQSESAFILRYAYYQNPYYHITYAEYIQKNIAEWLLNTEEEAWELLQDEYEQYMMEQAMNHKCISIRYDFSPDQYKPDHHPTSHLHIWNNENFRLPSSLTITPQNFTLFILKQIYPEIWIRNITYLKAKSSSTKPLCGILPITLFNADEKNGLFLG